MVVSAIASYMAKHGITDYGEGLDRIQFDLYGHLQTSGEFMGLSAENFLLEKVRVRAKEFNTIQNPAARKAAVQCTAVEYLQSAKGE